ncbi:PHD finger protein ALFIN-LIKE 3-like isoform X2 [Mangifera indica]|uniref:PHD finger protein ALFIN-LIKE 3-like isoform X2 n=1 Tax=Mangifera indica TaxID=29780 RepID=UPI001CFA7AC6|nr:PHD finger protein ALFIN-LIKE 3-like isoform X2 [Mangifera indica]
MSADEVPREVPEPALGVNFKFSKDGMHWKEWFSLVGVHSDCWLLAVALYFGARLNRNERWTSPRLMLGLSVLHLVLHKFETLSFVWICGLVLITSYPSFQWHSLDNQKESLLKDIDGRKRLFRIINDLPTLFEVVSCWMLPKDKPSVESGGKSRNSSKMN